MLKSAECAMPLKKRRREKRRASRLRPKKMRRRLSPSAEQEIVAAAKAARRQLTAHAADLAVGLAQKQIHVDPATDQALVRNFAGQLASASGQFGKGRKLAMASVASTYARAFADVVFNAHLDAARALADCVRLPGSSARARSCDECGRIPPSRRIRSVSCWMPSCSETGLIAPVRNFVAVLIDHRRLPFLSRIVEQVEKELDARLGFAEAQISSARELGDTEKRTLEDADRKSDRQEGARTVMVWIASLLGGAVVRIGSTIYDGSVKGQLEKIQERR